MSARFRRALPVASAVLLASLLTGCGGDEGGEGQGGSASGHSATGHSAASSPAPDPAPADGSPAGDRPGDDGSGTSETSGTSGTSGSEKARSAPVRLEIPAIGVDTPVMGLGLAQDGTVEVPPIAAHDRAGWYRNSPAPGRTGPSVILGHVTVGRYGDGVFRRLDRLHRGDKIVARLKNGDSARFAVRSVRTVAKAEFPAEEVYGDVARPELRLITCGGERDGDGYLDNVIVYASLSPGEH